MAIQESRHRLRHHLFRSRARGGAALVALRLVGAGACEKPPAAFEKARKTCRRTLTLLFLLAATLDSAAEPMIPTPKYRRASPATSGARRPAIGGINDEGILEGGSQSASKQKTGIHV